MDDSQVLIHCYQECREERQTCYQVRHYLTYYALSWQGVKRHHQVHGDQGEEEQVGQQVHHQQVYDKAVNKSYFVNIDIMIISNFFLLLS